MDFSRGTLSKYLSHKFGGHVIVDNVVKFPRGTSRETRFVRYRQDGGEAAEIVLRSDIPAGSIDPTPLEQEYFIYERLSRTDLPVASALFWEDDSAWTDTPFYVRARIDGDWNIPHFSDPAPEYDELRVAVATEHMRKLAMIHRVDWRALGLQKWLPAPEHEGEAAQVNINRILTLFDEIAIEPIPLLLEAREWLVDRAPKASALCLCKGTNGYGEEVFRGREIVALSDWEEASIGDPAADFAFTQGFLFDLERNGRPLWNLQIALDVYRAAGGVAVTVEAVRYYQLVRALRLAVLSHNAGAALTRASNASIRQGWTGTEVLHLTKHILASAMGLIAPIEPERFGQLNDTVDMQ